MISHIWPNPQTNSNTYLLTLGYCVSSTRWHSEATSYINYPSIPQKIKIWAIIPFWAIATAQSCSLHNGSWLKVAKELWLRFQLGAVSLQFLAQPWQHYLKRYSRFSYSVSKGGTGWWLEDRLALHELQTRWNLQIRDPWDPESFTECLRLCRGFRFIPGESNQFSSFPLYD